MIYGVRMGQQVRKACTSRRAGMREYVTVSQRAAAHNVECRAVTAVRAQVVFDSYLQHLGPWSLQHGLHSAAGHGHSSANAGRKRPHEHA